MKVTMRSKSPSACVESLERFLDCLGHPGRYQLLVYVLLSFNFILLSFTELSNTFYNRVSDHRCKLSPEHRHLGRFDESYPVENRNGKKVFSKCVMWSDPLNRTSGLKNCAHGWEYRASGNEWTVASEWNLVCEDSYLVSLIPMSQSALSCIGAILFGLIADKFGRKPVLLFTVLLELISAGSIYFIDNFIVYIVLKGFQGLIGAGLFIVSYVLCIEVLPSKYRAHGAIGIQVVTCSSAICLVLTSHFVQHWRYIHLSITVPFAVTIMYIWLIPESLRWLITESKLEESKCSSERILRYNKLPIPENLITELRRINKLQFGIQRQVPDANTSPDNSHVFWDLFKGPEIRKRTLIMLANGFTSSLSFSLLSKTVPPLTHTEDIDIVIESVINCGSAMIVLFLVIRFGCRIPLCCCLTVVGMLGILSAVLPQIITDPLLIVQMIAFLSLLGRTLSFVCLAIAQLYAAELFPTTLRTNGVGLVYMCAVIGSLLGPQVFLLKNISIAALPFVIIGVLTLLCCVLTAFLPPTRLLPLPGTPNDIEDQTEKVPKTHFAPIYTLEGTLSSRTQDIIRNEAVIKVESTPNINTSSIPTHQNTVRFKDEVVEVSSDNSDNFDEDNNYNRSISSDSDDGGFTTFGKSGVKRFQRDTRSQTGSDLATFIKTNPLMIPENESEDDNNILRNDTPTSYNDYSPHFFLRSKNFVDLDTAML